MSPSERRTSHDESGGEGDVSEGVNEGLRGGLRSATTHDEVEGDDKERDVLSHGACKLDVDAGFAPMRDLEEGRVSDRRDARARALARRCDAVDGQRERDVVLTLKLEERVAQHDASRRGDEAGARVDGRFCDLLLDGPLLIDRVDGHKDRGLTARHVGRRVVERHPKQRRRRQKR